MLRHIAQSSTGPEGLKFSSLSQQHTEPLLLLPTLHYEGPGKISCLTTLCFVEVGLSIGFQGSRS